MKKRRGVCINDRHHAGEVWSHDSKNIKKTTRRGCELQQLVIHFGNGRGMMGEKCEWVMRNGPEKVKKGGMGEG